MVPPAANVPQSKGFDWSKSKSYIDIVWALTPKEIENKAIEAKSIFFIAIIFLIGTLILNDKTHIFEGVINGTISAEKKGIDGFGYDPIFIPEGETRTFAEMTLEEKNQQSHRARAFEKMVSFLNLI